MYDRKDDRQVIAHDVNSIHMGVRLSNRMVAPADGIGTISITISRKASNLSC